MGCVPARRINSRPFRAESIKTITVDPRTNIEVRETVATEIVSPTTFVGMPSPPVTFNTATVIPMAPQPMMLPNHSPPVNVPLPSIRFNRPPMHPHSAQWQFIPNIEPVPPVIQPPNIPVQQMAPQSLVHSQSPRASVYQMNNASAKFNTAHNFYV
jgi:hypothetical protein